jgi:hypothetical protein
MRLLSGQILQSLTASSPLGPNILLGTLFSNTLTLYAAAAAAGARGSVVVKTLCYKPEGRGIASR